MNKFRLYILLKIFIVIFFTGISLAQNPTIELIENYNNWNWNTWVMSNDLVTIATVPVIGARIMQYDLGDHPSIYVNPAEFGNSYTPSFSNFWPNFGGFKNWPAPQAMWNWPPPPTLDYGSYEAVADIFPDSVSLTVTSPVEQWRAPDLRIKRRTTLYKSSSRLKVEQTIINESTEIQHWGIWDITQSFATHTGQFDFDNFWVYFPINPDSRYGDSGVYMDLRGDSNPSDAWVGEVAPGIYGVKYRPDDQKLFADSHIGWICYVDELTGYTYAKTYDIFEGAEYPDDGARNEVWLNGNPNYFEVEVVSPVVDLPANGGSYTFTENWWATKVNGPILSVTDAGAVKSFKYDITAKRFTGEFGVFHTGKARLEFTDSSGIVIDTSLSYDVTPLETFILNDSTKIPPLADSVNIVIFDNENNFIGILISRTTEDLITDIKSFTNYTPAGFKLKQNYPNPFNPVTKINYSVPKMSFIKINVYDILGNEIATLVNEEKLAGDYAIEFNGSNLSSGIYFYRMQSGTFIDIKKFILMK
jgi:hypothetical protein